MCDKLPQLGLLVAICCKATCKCGSHLEMGHSAAFFTTLPHSKHCSPELPLRAGLLFAM